MFITHFYLLCMMYFILLMIFAFTECSKCFKIDQQELYYNYLILFAFFPSIYLLGKKDTKLIWYFLCFLRVSVWIKWNLLCCSLNCTLFNRLKITHKCYLYWLRNKIKFNKSNTNLIFVKGCSLTFWSWLLANEFILVEDLTVVDFFFYVQLYILFEDSLH